MPDTIFSCQLCGEVSRIRARIMECEAKGDPAQFVPGDRVFCREGDETEAWYLGTVMAIRLAPWTHEPSYGILLDKDDAGDSAPQQRVYADAVEELVVTAILARPSVSFYQPNQIRELHEDDDELAT